MPTAEYGYRPDYAVPPGETLREALEALGMTQAELARRTGLSTKHINQMVQGVVSISPDTALALEHVVGVPARLWNALEANYQAQRLRLRSRTLTDDDAAWVKSFPARELVGRGWIQPTTSLAELRDQIFTFFGVANRDAWDAIWRTPDAAFRRSRAFETDPMATAAWLRIGELQAASIETAAFDRSRFAEALGQIRGLMSRPPTEFEPAMKRLLAASGVALVLVGEVKGCRANGATRWMSPTKALIQLSVRYKWEDVFWFSFFHEAGHLVLHGKRVVFVDLERAGSPDEEEANAFAADLLIPGENEGELLRIRDLAGAISLARKLEIPPSIVIGRLQREALLPYGVGLRYRPKFELVAEPGNAR